jgi:predicted MPP superfamily phosphohydrolase
MEPIPRAMQTGLDRVVGDESPISRWSRKHIALLSRWPLPDARWPWSGGQLEVGLRRALHVREERLSTRHDAYRLLYVSDIHLRRGRTDTLCRQVLDSVTRCHPDVVLLGGDLVDCRSELVELSELVRKVQQVAPVLAIGGNHDRGIGIDRVRAAVVHGGGRWIDDGSARLTHRGRLLVISGPEAAAPVDGHVRVLCAHDPRIWKTSRLAGYDLVLAGHLHGCQLVAGEYRGRLFPGAFFYPYCFLNAHHGSTRLVVSRGVSDLFPIRWKCPREVVLCHV